MQRRKYSEWMLTKSSELIHNLCNKHLMLMLRVSWWQSIYISISLQYLCKGGYPCILPCPDLTRPTNHMPSMCTPLQRAHNMQNSYKTNTVNFWSKDICHIHSRILTATLTSINSRSNPDLVFQAVQLVICGKC